MRKKTLFAVLAATMIVSGCGSSAPETASGARSIASSTSFGSVSTMSLDSTDHSSGWEYESTSDTDIISATAEADSDSNSAIRDVDTSAKIVRNMSYSVETTDMTALIDSIQTKLVELGGYIENSQVSGGNARYDDGYYLDSEGRTQYDSSYTPSYAGRLSYNYATYTIRIPAEKLDEFANEIESTSNVTSQSTTTEDITSSYVDTDSRRKSLEEELETLEAMAKKAETVDEMIQIQSQISDVWYNLENIQSQLKVMDQRVAYSTVNLDITEVTVLSNVDSNTLSWTDRIANGFKSSCENVVYAVQEGFINLVSNLPMILFRLFEIVIVGLVLLGIIKAIKAIKRIRKGKKSGKTPKLEKENSKEAVITTADNTETNE